MLREWAQQAVVSDSRALEGMERQVRVGLLIFRKNISRGGAVAATVGFVLTIVIALVMLLR